MSHPSVRLLPRSSGVVRRAAPFVVWILVWGALNTGGGAVPAFGGFVDGPGPLEAFHFLRALLPVALLPVWTAHVAGRGNLRVRTPSRPEKLLILYGAVGLLAGLTRGSAIPALYWGVAFLAPFAAAELILARGDRLERSRLLNRLTWAVTGLVLLALLAASGGALFMGEGLGISGYGVVNRVETIAGMPAVRSSGLSRLAGVVAVVTLVSALCARRGRRLAWGALSAAAWLVVWFMQSRGSLVAAGGAGLVVAALWFRGESLLATGVLLSLAAGLAVSLLPAELIERTLRSGIRVPWEAFLEPSGRTDAWAQAWEAFRTGPVVGRGFQADRALAGRNAQNGVIYAFLTGGLAGGLAYVGALALLWRKLVGLLSDLGRLARRDRRTLLQATGVITLFTLRHYPENTSALYSVDLLILLPALLFVVELDRARRREAGPGPAGAAAREEAA